MSFSLHPNTNDIGRHSVYSRGWEVSNELTFRDLGYQHEAYWLADVCLNHLVGCGIWNQGVRSEKAWRYADWIALDFDAGPPLEIILPLVQQYVHVVGTTKSHQIAKGNAEPCDRFRVFLQLAERCSDLSLFRDGQRSLIGKLGGDLATIDGARMFQPCKTIVSKASVGAGYKLARAVPLRPRAVGNFHGDRIPRYVSDWLSGGVGDGERNKICFRIGAILTACGMDESTIVDTIMNSSIPLNTSDSVWREVRSAVRNGARRELTGRK